MKAALITLAGLFALELGAVIFAAGKLWQRVADIEKTVTDIKRIVFAGFNCGEKEGESNDEKETAQTAHKSPLG